MHTIGWTVFSFLKTPSKNAFYVNVTVLLTMITGSVSYPVAEIKLFIRRHQWFVKEIGRVLFHLSTSWLSLHTLQVLIQKNVANCGQVFETVQRAFCLNQRIRGVEKMPDFAEKRLVRKKLHKTVFELSLKNKIKANNWTRLCRICRKIKTN